MSLTTFIILGLTGFCLGIVGLIAIFVIAFKLDKKRKHE